jgi:hypothetical protein
MELVMKNRLTICFSLIFVLLPLLSVPSWSMLLEEDYPLTAIAKRPVSPDGPRVVFDFCDTMGSQLHVPREKAKAVAKQYPDAQLIFFWNRAQNKESFLLPPKGVTYFFYPHWGEVFLTLLDWGWHVDFFSSNIFAINEEIAIPAYLKVALEPYSQDIEADYAALIQRGDLRIFTRCHLSPRERLNPGQNQNRYTYKKDLSILGEIKDTILVNTRQLEVPEEQYPFIEMSSESSCSFISSLDIGFTPKLENHETPLNNAAYVLGILSECKELLDQKRVTSLRAALNVVLKAPPQGVYSTRNAPSWSLDPERGWKSQSWMQQGNVLIQQMRVRAKQTRKEKTNYCEIEVDQPFNPCQLF